MKTLEKPQPTPLSAIRQEVEGILVSIDAQIRSAYMRVTDLLNNPPANMTTQNIIDELVNHSEIELTQEDLNFTLAGWKSIANGIQPDAIEDETPVLMTRETLKNIPPIKAIV